jgi:hypothetical protein
MCFLCVGCRAFFCLTLEDIVALSTWRNVVAQFVFTLLRYGACSEAPCESTFSIAGQLENLNMKEETLADKAFIRTNNRKDKRRPREDVDVEEPPMAAQLLCNVPDAVQELFGANMGIEEHIVTVLRKAFDAEMASTQEKQAREKPAARGGRCEHCGKPPANCTGSTGDQAKCTTHGCPNFSSLACFLTTGAGDFSSFGRKRKNFVCSICAKPAPTMK